MPKMLKKLAIICLVAVTSLTVLGSETYGAADRKLNILTINLMLINPDAPWDWPERADTLVSFIQQQEELEPVDFILCQEGHGGTLSQILGGGGDTILDLQQRLQAAGLTYHAASIICFQNLNTGGFDIESNFLVGILSKYPILRVEQGEIFCSATPSPEPQTRKIIACITKIPKIGQVNLISAHLPNFCGGVRGQGEQLMAFADSVAENYPATLSILGGDFNAGPDSDLYSYLTSEQELVDTFAAANDLLTNPGYTYGVLGNPFGSSTEPARIDYIFAKTGGQNLKGGKVVSLSL